MHDSHEREQSRLPQPFEHHESVTGARSISEYLTHLLRFCQQIQGARDAAMRLSQEIARLSGNQVQLRLHKDEASASSPQLPSSLTAVVSLSSECGDDVALLFFCNTSLSASLPLSLAEVEALAEFCNFALPSLKRTAFIRERLQGIALPAVVNLTRREQDVLQLMGRGDAEEAIAEALHITPQTVTKHRHSLYAKLGVNRLSDALVVACELCLYSPLEDIFPLT